MHAGTHTKGMMHEATDLSARSTLRTLALRTLAAGSLATTARSFAATAGTLAAAARSLAAARSTAAAALIITRAKTPQPALDGVDVTECLLAPLGVGRQDAKSSTIGIGVDRAGGEKEAEDCDGKFLGSNEHGGQSLF